MVEMCFYYQPVSKQDGQLKNWLAIISKKVKLSHYHGENPVLLLTV